MEVRTRIVIFMIASSLITQGVVGKEFFNSLESRIGNLFDKVARAVPSSTDRKTQMMVNQELKAFVQELDELKETIAEKAERGTSGPHKKDMLEQLDDVDSSLDQLQRAVNNSAKKRRFIGAIVDTTRQGINTVGQGFQEFVDSLKPVKGKAASIALDLHYGITQAAERVLDAMIAAG